MINSNRLNFQGTIGLPAYIINNKHLEYEEELKGVIINKCIKLEKRTAKFLASAVFCLGYQFNTRKKFQNGIKSYLNLPFNTIGKEDDAKVSKGISIDLINHFQKKMLKL